ncbi:SCO family protein [Pseudomonas syringae pv. actinidifoliorum]|uniref:SCO family protein n=1 Tax=Pseudomonas syringae TaxID=317 RepID=UPI00073E6E5D|nr:SCO family protein [Pseudomonas syringae]NAS96540.1 SCO family protein [Pseudomonas syringae pv. actinidifoliorum]NAT15196.1 SCO family protein [Pseudomonas syringae pv. actinidifoliorum]NAT59657.1 SCO family protein [Pseudomonas syringae pv. actinidifoliorum]NAT64114.1 SCO family protein [Pseudomonas syringae pv. actinidifoliorum]
MTRAQKTVFIVAAIVALVLGLVLSRLLPGSGPNNQAALNEAGIVLLPKSRQLPALSMIDQNGAAVALDGLKDQWTLMFFGYTFCPDICPTTLAQIKQIRSELPKAAVERMRVVLVSVDPNRDTPQQLKEYLSYFDPQYIGLTAPVADIQKLANSVSIPFIPADTSKPNYFVDHSGNLALIGPDGTQRGFIRAPLNNQKLVKQLPGLLERD